VKTRAKVTLERTYRASLDDVWEMWTTKDGIESWWGPDGFAVKVHEIDVRPGGTLLYEMIAVAPEMREFMRTSGMPPSTMSRITFTVVEPKHRLEYRHPTDFIPGKVEPYDVLHSVELRASGDRVHLVMTFDEMHDEEWTNRATMGWKNELEKLAKALEAAG
jgi:uncharacterized protein YndB with AHSA1/START domain